MNNFNVLNAESGVLATSWNATQTQESTHLYNLEFTALQSGKIGDLLSIDHHPTPAEAYDFEGQIMSVDLDIAPLQSAFSVFPNPVRQEAINLNFFTAELQEVQVTLHSMDGKTLTTHVYQPIVAGSQLTELSVKELPAGAYLIRLYNGKEEFPPQQFIKK